MIYGDNEMYGNPYNSLVFKYGNEAKSNSLTIRDQILLNGTPDDKLLLDAFVGQTALQPQWK